MTSRTYAEYLPACQTADCDGDDSDALIADAEFMAHFHRGASDLDAGRYTSADDLERELGI